MKIAIKIMTDSGTLATFRAQVLNMTNTYGWSVAGGSQYFTFQGPRRVALSLAADF